MNNRTKNNTILGIALLAISTVSLSAQSSTTWAGYFTDTITPGTGTAYKNSVISFPLQGTANLQGQMVGQVTSVASTAVTPATTPPSYSSNTVTVTNANWLPGVVTGSLSDPANPCLIQFTSGNAAGRIFLISTTTGVDMTGTILTLDTTDGVYTNLQGLVNPGDTYQIIPADTISKVFGTGTATGASTDPVTGNLIGVPLGGASSTTSDIVQILNGPGGSFITYYYNYNPPPGTSKGWVTVGGIAKASANVVIRPDTAVFYQRLANPINPSTSMPVAFNLTMTGQVPSVARQSVVSNIGSTFLSNYWPNSGASLSGTLPVLSTCNIQTLPGWVPGTTATQSTADTVQVFNGASWTQYYYNPNASAGAGWYSVGGIPAPGNPVSIPPGGAILVSKKGSTTGQGVVAQILPYIP